MIVKVKLSVNGAVIPIACGKGEQTFKWLASVIKFRLQQHIKDSFEKTDYIVNEITNVDGELLNPNDRLFEHEFDGSLSVTAMLVRVYPVSFSTHTLSPFPHTHTPHH